MLVVICPLDCTPSLTEVNRTTAMCEGFSLVLECSTEGPGSTVFKGDLLNCKESHNEIPYFLVIRRISLISAYSLLSACYFVGLSTRY